MVPRKQMQIPWQKIGAANIRKWYRKTSRYGEIKNHPNGQLTLEFLYNW